MLRFLVLDEHGAASFWPLRHACLIGPDNAVIPGEISFDQGVISCDAKGRSSTALALQWDAGEAGLLTLETCLLPEREQPHLLSLEFARRRIMLYLVKLEEWSLFDLPADDPVSLIFERAHRIFMEALALSRDTGAEALLRQNQLAQQSLTQAIVAGEQLVARHAAVVIGRNPAKGESDFYRPGIGCVVQTERFTPALQQVVADTFDFVTMPTRWIDLEPEEGRYDFASLDRWIEWAVRKASMPVTAGPLVDFRQHCVPDWLYIWENDYEALRQLVYEHVKKVVIRYRRAVKAWTIVSGLHVNNNFTLSLEQIVDLTRLCSLMIRKLQPGARIQIEIVQPFGEYSAHNQHAVPPLLYAELLFQAGVSIDTIGVRLEMGDIRPGRTTRDMMQLADMLDRLGEFEKPLAITALMAPSSPPIDATLGEDRRDDPGYWKAPWSERTQADWLTAAINTAVASQHVASLCWGQLYDDTCPANMVGGGLITQDGNSKLSLNRITEIRRVLRRAPSQAHRTPNKPAAST